MQDDGPHLEVLDCQKKAIERYRLKKSCKSYRHSVCHWQLSTPLYFKRTEMSGTAELLQSPHFYNEE